MTEPQRAVEIFCQLQALRLRLDLIKFGSAVMQRAPLLQKNRRNWLRCAGSMPSGIYTGHYGGAPTGPRPTC